MRTFDDMKKAVMAYALRDEESFVKDGFNNLEQAINDAHQWVQRSHVFERAKVFATVPAVSTTTGADLSTAVLYGTTTSVQVRSLIRAWIPSTNGIHLPVGIVSRDAWANERRRLTSSVTSVRDENVNQGEYDQLRIVQFGTTIHFSTQRAEAFNSQTALDVHFDLVKWLPDYSDPEDNDFLLDYCFDFMRLRSMLSLNNYLKEDQRIPVSATLLDDAWKSVIAWDSSILFLGTEDTQLE